MSHQPAFARLAPIVLAICLPQTAIARIYVANAGSNGPAAVTEYQLPATGNVSPAVNLSGNATDLSVPYGVAADANHVYVADIGAGAGSIFIYGLNASGDTSPVAVISGDNTGLDSPQGIAVDAKNIYVTDPNVTNSITVYPLTATGNASPSTTIIGANTGLDAPNGIAVDAGNIYVTNNSSITVYPLTADGNVEPTATIGGSKTGLTAPLGIAVDANHIYVANGNSVLEFALTANGNVAPTATISGAHTGLNSPYGIAVNASHIFVSNDGTPNTVTVYAVGATGNATPSATISGASTGLNTPLGIAVIPDPIPFTWAVPAAITYGTAISSTQLDLETSVAGTVVYSPLAGTVLGAGTQTLTATITPTDTTDYAVTTASVNLTVNKAPAPAITWATPAAITYGTKLSGTQLDATASSGGVPVVGTFSYSPAAGTELDAGSHNLSVTFSSPNYASATGGTTITVNKATPVLSWTTPAGISYGTKLSAAQLNAVAMSNGAVVAGTYAYSPAAGTVLGVGNQNLGVTFTPTDTTDYTPATGSATLTVNQATPAITWAAPAAITYGTKLSATQLNAVAKSNGAVVAGTYAYSPVAGTVLSAGNQNLGVTFTPTDTTDYTAATGSAMLTVNKAAAPSITWAAPAAITYGTALSATQLDAVAKVDGSAVDGTLTYSPAAGTVLDAGNQTLNVTYSSPDYGSATGSVSLTVNKAAAPSITWATPAAITYGTALSATQLDAVAKVDGTIVDGTFTYTPAAGSVLKAGSQTLKATFASTNYASATSSTTIAVNKANPVITWAAPTAIAYGTALSATQLDAVAKFNGSPVAGTFAYTPSSGTKPDVGSQTLSTTFTPTDTTDFSSATATAKLTVTKAAPVITWATPAAITYGTALSGTQLDAVAKFNGSALAGTFAYTPSSGTMPSAGTQTLEVTFTPTDTADYAPATANVQLAVNKAAPVLTWAKPAAITYGTALSGKQLDAVAKLNGSALAGTFAYTPPSGTKPKAGSQTLEVTFTPADTTDYASVTDSTTLTVNKAAPVITWATPAAITYGTALSGTQLDAVAKFDGSAVAGTFAYSPVAGTLPHAGSQSLNVTFTPTDTTDYTSPSTSVQLTVNQATPVITWPTPATIVFGTALSDTQLDAVANFNGAPVAGTFAYSPPAGTMPAIGNQPLGVTFTPADTQDYATATLIVNLDVVAVGTPIATINDSSAPNALAVDASHIYAVNSDNSVTVYPLNANGNVTPTATISGSRTGLNFPSGIAVDASHIYVSNVNTSTVTVYPLDANGNVTPTATISGNVTGLGSPDAIAVNDDHIYVANYTSNVTTLTVYPLNANGNVTPTTTLTIIAPEAMTLDANYVYVANRHNLVDVYGLDATGNTQPTASISGTNTDMDYPLGIAVDSRHIYVSNSDSSTVTIYPLDATGNAAPTYTLGGSNTGIYDPWGLAVDSNNLYVANSSGTITVYALDQIPALKPAFVAGAMDPQAAPEPAPLPKAPDAEATAIPGANGGVPATAAIPGSLPVLGGAPAPGPHVTDLVGGEVSAGSPLIGGFTVAGNTPRKFLIWAVAPSLESPGMDDPLSALSLAVFDSSGRNLAQSDPWHTSEAGASDLAAAEAATGAFPLPSGSKDSAVIVTLAPGNYTAVASGVGNTAGTVLVEICEIP